MSPTLPLPPGSTIGVLGGGQLGRMLALATRRMGYRIVTWIGGPDTGPAGVADHVIEEPFDSPAGLAAFLERAQVATVEFENIPRSLLEAVAAKIPLMPGAQAVAICQHRERETRFLEENGIPCARFAVIENAEQLRTALAELPDNGGILKTAEFGYDGKGQLSVNRASDPEAVWEAFATPRAVLEERIDLAAELSVLVVRDGSGRALSYDPAENFHRDHILDVSIVPARLEPSLLDEARAIALRVAEALDYRGLLAVEFFLSGDGRLLVNEMAPRPHNSGHHTIDSCITSQFQQQIRTVCGFNPGSPRQHSPAVMVNLLGDVWPAPEKHPDWSPVLADPACFLHLYGKRLAKPGRKMGHFTVLGETIDDALARAASLRSSLGLPPLPEA